MKPNSNNIMNINTSFNKKILSPGYNNSNGKSDLLRNRFTNNSNSKASPIGNQVKLPSNAYFGSNKQVNAVKVEKLTLNQQIINSNSSHSCQIPNKIPKFHIDLSKICNNNQNNEIKALSNEESI